MKMGAQDKLAWHRYRAQRGSALLVVLLMLGTIAALAAVAARSVSGAAIEMGAAQMMARHESDLRTGIELGVVAILKLGEGMRSAEASVNLPGRRVHARVTNERARIDLNTASPAVLAALLKSNGVIDSDAVALANNVAEWRGGSASQVLGTPADHDQAAAGFARSSAIELPPNSELRKAPKQTVGTRFFLHPMQLASVPGFSKALVTRILPLLTVANGTNQLDPFIAARGVLLALPGVSPTTVDAFLGARQGNTGQELAVKLLGVADTLVNSSAAASWRIEITSVEQAGRTYRGEAVVAVLDGDSELYRVLYVLENP
jgi:general secretion pathway protein K